MDLPELSGCFVLLLAGLCLLQVHRIACQKLGMAAIWVASALAAYFLTHSVILAVTMLMAWIFFPIWEMVFILRQLRLPRHRELIDGHPPGDSFEELSEMSRDLISLGFQKLDECCLMPAQHEQYYRIFDREDDLTYATIGYLAQGAIGFHFVAFTSNSKDGRRWVTWDYPLTYGLSMPPHIAVYRALHCHDLAELYQAHLDFLAANEIQLEDLAPGERTAPFARAQLQETLNQQIEYNISRGFLAPSAGANAENFAYSWRGTLYVAGQILRDLIL